MNPDIEVRPSAISGRGVFARRLIRRGETVFRWDLSRRIRRDQIDAVTPEERHFLNPFDDQFLLLVGEPERYVNHSCANNTRVERFTDVALRDILPGEEITSDYRSGGAEIDFECRCGAPNCAAMLDVREEQPDDAAAVRELHRRAFGQEQEGRLVDALRANRGVRLSLVATLNGQVVGHILFSPAVVGAVEGAALGPMAVRPEHQRQGIGSQLVREGIRKLTEAGCPFIIVLGHAGFYPRFGFEPARARGITCEWSVPDDAFMVLVLDEVKTRGMSGPAVYRREFSTVF